MPGPNNSSQSQFIGRNEENGIFHYRKDLKTANAQLCRSPPVAPDKLEAEHEADDEGPHAGAGHEEPGGQVGGQVGWEARKDWGQGECHHGNYEPCASAKSANKWESGAKDDFEFSKTIFCKMRKCFIPFYVSKMYFKGFVFLKIQFWIISMIRITDIGTCWQCKQG